MTAKTYASLLVLLLSLAGIFACNDSHQASDVAVIATPATEERPQAETPGEQQWGDLFGKVVYDGDPPEPRMIPIKAEANLFGPTKEANDLIVSPKNRGIANALVFLHLYSSESVNVHPDYDASAKDNVELVIENARYRPHLLLMRTSQKVVLKNMDATNHNANALPAANAQPLFMQFVGKPVEAIFPREEKTPFVIKCSIHPWMKCFAMVKHHPYMAKTGENGRFQIRNLPVGEHRFRLWHEKAGWLKQTSFDNGQTDDRGRLVVTIQPGKNDLGTAPLDPAVFK